MAQDYSARLELLNFPPWHADDPWDGTDALAVASAKVWPLVLSVARRELADKVAVEERKALTLEAWEDTLLSVAETLKRHRGKEAIRNLEAFLVGTFQHRLSRAIVVVVATVSVWAWRSRQPSVITAHNHVVADMRNWLILRGEQGPGKGPFVFERGFDDVSFYLPEGNRPGAYEVAIFQEEPGEPLATATGTATIENGMTQMNVGLDLSRISPGYYLVGIRLPGTDWSYSPLIIK